MMDGGKGQGAGVGNCLSPPVFRKRTKKRDFPTVKCPSPIARPTRPTLRPRLPLHRGQGRATTAHSQLDHSRRLHKRLWSWLLHTPPLPTPGPPSAQPSATRATARTRTPRQRSRRRPAGGAWCPGSLYRSRLRCVVAAYPCPGVAGGNLLAPPIVVAIHGGCPLTQDGQAGHQASRPCASCPRRRRTGPPAAMRPALLLAALVVVASA